MADELDDDTNDTDSTTPSTSNPSSGQSTQNDVDPTTLFNQARQNLDQSQTSGVTPEQLQALSQHQGSNAMVNMFMQMVAGANHVDASPYQAIGNNSVQQQAQRLALQSQLSQQNLARAGAAEQLGSTVLSSQQKQLELQKEQAPLTSLQQATILSLAKQSGQKAPDLTKLTQKDYQDAISGSEQTADIAAKLEQARAMGQYYGGRNIVPTTLPGGQKGFINKTNGQVTDALGNPLPSTNNTTPNTPTTQPNSVTTPNKPVTPSVTNASDVINNDQQLNHAKILETAQKDFQKNYGVPDATLTNTLDTINKLVELSQKGDYKAANSLATQTAKAFEGLNGQRITNQMINMENDPTASGLINRAVQLIQGASGQGKVTAQDAQYMLETSKALQQVHNKTLTQVLNGYNTRISHAIGRPFQDNAYFLGRDLPEQQNATTESTPSQSTQSNINAIPYSEYMKQKQGANK